MTSRPKLAADPGAGIDPVALLESITRAQTSYIGAGDVHAVYEGLLRDLLVLTRSELGFIGDVRTTPDGRPEMTFAAVAGVDDSLARAAVGPSAPATAHGGTVAAARLAFSGAATLFGRTMATLQPVLAGPAETATLRLPPGHPAVATFLALPILSGKRLVAVAGLANRADPYGQKDVEALGPLTRVVAQLVESSRAARERELLEERKRAAIEALRREREAKLGLWANVFVHAHEGIMVTDATGTILDVNDAYLRMTGYLKEDLVGRNPRVLGSGEQERGCFEEMWRCLLTDGAWRGELVNRRKDGTRFLQNTAISVVREGHGGPSHYIGLAHDVTAAREAERRLHQMAFFDPLTGLPNRSLLADRLGHAIAQAARAEGRLAVCYLDLDGFKAVNDRWGHEAGDALLVEVSARLLEGVRGGDTVARLGGDEFVLLMGGLSGVEDCDVTLRRILASLAAPFDVVPGGVTVSGSIGVAFHPHDGADSDTLLRHADQALYAAKEDGRNRYHLFDSARHQRARAYRSAVERVAEGLKAGEFRLHYQPRVDMRSGRPVGVEALVRWQHPQRGLLAPREFLEVVEDAELAVAFGEWVIEEALSQVERWADSGWSAPVSINVSGRHLQTPEFFERLQQMLARHPRLGPRQLELEIVETAALSELARVAELIEACRRAGVGFAIDDFGTGFSSLTYLRRLPAETLKIDQSFVRDMLEDPEDTAIVEGVIGLGLSFRRRLVAEGVETPDQGLLLMRMGCDLAQGFAIARPMPADELLRWWGSWKPPALWTEHAGLYYAIDDVSLFTIEVDQRHWTRRALAVLRDPSAGPPWTGENAGNCAFGRWLRDIGRSRYAGRPAFARLRESHDRFHALAEPLLDRAGEGIPADAPRVKELIVQQGRLLDTLHEIQQSVALRRDARPGAAP